MEVEAQTHPVQPHELADDSEARAVGVHVRALLEQVGDGLQRVEHEDFVAEAVEEYQITCFPFNTLCAASRGWARGGEGRGAP